MTEHRPGTTASARADDAAPPLPRDMPDQQVGEGEDPLDVPAPPERGGRSGGARDAGEGPGGLPDLDESGAGRGEPRQAGAHPEHPVPDEQTG
ncbi:hypothetical protein ACH4NO_12920 [Streptomyces olivaceus]|uniref:hypothetical protein n=1 Tax=Streptomyces TaxID=1883 RepID=UPI00081BC1A2|nr:MULTISPECIES: hypothetical protein [Streptomyces]MCW8218879.1 hypothetical protein [Streptomyces griseolus]SCE20330.1 hypothetical protein GA0115247_12761 [Streptomyces sp. PalvLS-984]SDD18643.1 hypothetical protein F558DRAFT_03541 [Streptomyces sp. AmelKG-A3]